MSLFGAVQDIELQPLMSFGSTADGFRSLGRNRVRSLKRLVATGIEFDFKDVESDLKANNGLENLHLEGVQMTSWSKNTEPVIELLRLLQCLRPEKTES